MYQPNAFSSSLLARQNFLPAGSQSGSRDPSESASRSLLRGVTMIKKRKKSYADLGPRMGEGKKTAVTQQIHEHFAAFTGLS